MSNQIDVQRRRAERNRVLCVHTVMFGLFVRIARRRLNADETKAIEWKFESKSSRRLTVDRFRIDLIMHFTMILMLLTKRYSVIVHSNKESRKTSWWTFAWRANDEFRLAVREPCCHRTIRNWLAAKSTLTFCVFRIFIHKMPAAERVNIQFEINSVNIFYGFKYCFHYV